MAMTLTKAGAGLGLSIVAARGGAMPRWVMYWNQSCQRGRQVGSVEFHEAPLEYLINFTKEIMD